VVIGFAVSAYISRLAALGLKGSRSGEELAGLLHETLSGMQVIQSFTRETSQYSALREKAEQHGQNQQTLYFRNYMVHILTEVLGIVAIGFLFLAAVLTYGLENKLLLAQLVAFIYVMSRIIPVIKMMNQDRGIVVSKWPYLDLVYDLVRLDNKTVIQDGNQIYAGLSNALKFEDVTFAYNGEDKFALRNAAFSIPKGKTTAIVGKSGAGKSTIVNLLLRFYDPQQGQILVDNVPLPDFMVRSYREKIGLVSQDTFIFNDTVRNNIAFGALEIPTDDLITEAAQRAGAHEFILDLPKGYDTVLGDRGIRLSGGQRQRISIARAILKNPEILILDEATSSVDAGTESLIHQAIADLSRNRTVIIIAHRPSAIQSADQVVVLQEGRVVEVGNQSQLLDQKGIYYDLLNFS
jgi:ABC-type multidrug transport system fused ATPase/permease subunit